MATDTSLVVVKKTKNSSRYKEPSKYKVVICNDDVTPVDFVIAMLVKVFNFNIDAAIKLTLQVHETGSAVAGIYPYEVAEQKAIDGIEMARANEFPLVIKTEPE
jgi:ATP-dependent Clp protease adaptor protein ClpS